MLWLCDGKDCTKLEHRPNLISLTDWSHWLLPSWSLVSLWRLDIFLTTRRSLLLPQTWLDCDQTCTRWSHMGLHPGYAQGQGQWSRDTDTFVMSRKLLLLADKWLDRDQTCTRWSAHGPTSRVCSRSRSKVTWYGHFSDYTKNASSTTNMTGSRPNLHTMVRTWACIQDVLKVKVKGHVIRTLFWLHENRFFYHKQDSIATKLAHDGPHIGLHPGYAQGQGQGQRSPRDTDTFSDVT